VFLEELEAAGRSGEPCWLTWVVGDLKTCEVVGGKLQGGWVGYLGLLQSGWRICVKIWTTLLSFCILNVAVLLFGDVWVSDLEGCERLPRLSSTGVIQAGKMIKIMSSMI
jgi:hypothetical protein